MNSDGTHEPTALSTAVLIEQVRHERQQFQDHHPTQGNVYAWELFRRALVLSDEAAWTGLYTLYERMVFSWVLQVQPRPHSFSDEDILSLVGDAFVKFAWHVSATKFAAFAESVPALLAYLKRCTRSCTYNALAQKRKQAREESLERVARATDVVDPRDPADLIAEEEVAHQLWHTLLRHMQSPAERVVLSSMAADVSPGDLFKQYPALFTSPADVYRIKHTIVSRCQRIPSLQVEYRKRC